METTTVEFVPVASPLESSANLSNPTVTYRDHATYVRTDGSGTRQLPKGTIHGVRRGGDVIEEFTQT